MAGEQPQLGVCYYPEHWPKSGWAEDAKRMVAMGLSWVRIGEFAWSRIEPSEGQYDWGWLDEAIHILASAGLKIVLGTPTATPPRWMLTKHPDMIAYDVNGRPRTFGSRRHYCFSHLEYKRECEKICHALGARYGDNPHIEAWQIDNEYGCHETVLSYSQSALLAFQDWLTDKYKTIESLNAAWGNVFWSMEYVSFDEIELPNLTVTEANPSHMMDFRRFSSHQVTLFNRVQCGALRNHTDRPLIHNYMGRVLDFDHFDVGADLEIASWDSYPLGFLEDRSDQDEDWRQRFVRQGDPDFQAFHHDLYRAVGQGRWWVMEQQPGPVNWAPYNPAPLPGMVRLWTWEAIAHGAETVNYFRWRQAPFAQEQMHAGLLRSDGAETEVCEEIKMLASELHSLNTGPTNPSRVAIVFDYASAWAWEVQPQGQSFDYFRLIFDCYRTLRGLGYSIDILPSTTRDFGERQLVLVPGLFTWTDDLKKAISDFKGNLLIGPRTGSKTENFHIPNDLPPNIDGFDLKITFVESLRPTEYIALQDGGFFRSWREQVETSEDVTLATSDGRPALVSKDKLHYVCGWPDEDAFASILNQIGMPISRLPEGVRCREFGDYQLYTNYTNTDQIVDGQTLSAASIQLIETASNKILIER